jgi:type IV secretion system protein VirB10
MPEPIANSPNQVPDEPELRRQEREPKGVLRKNLKPLLYLGAALLVIVAAIFSGSGKKTPPQKGANPHQPPQPTLQDSTDNNVQDLKNQVAAAQQKAAEQAANSLPSPDRSLPNGTPAPCVPGQPCAQQQSASTQQQLSPAAQEEQQLAAKDRELAYDARFASNLAYARQPDSQALQQQAVPAEDVGTSGRVGSAAAYRAAPGQTASTLIAPRAAGDPPSTPAAQTAAERKPEVNIDAAMGQPYVIYEGTALDTILMNRLDGDAAGPVKVLVSNPVYSHDRQHVLIPEGTIVLGEARKIGSAGFGQQRRMAVVFDRLIMPDGYSVDLDQFHGLDQIGEEGLKDKVNNHYLQIFGTSIALGIIAGAGEIEEGGGTITTSGSQAFTNGVASNVSQSATTVLDRFMQIPPTITIREGHRVKVYFTQDMLLPAYENHTIPQTY